MQKLSELLSERANWSQGRFYGCATKRGHLVESEPYNNLPIYTEAFIQDYGKLSMCLTGAVLFQSRHKAKHLNLSELVNSITPLEKVRLRRLADIIIDLFPEYGMINNTVTDDLYTPIKYALDHTANIIYVIVSFNDFTGRSFADIQRVIEEYDRQLMLKEG